MSVGEGAVRFYTVRAQRPQTVIAPPDLEMMQANGGENNHGQARALLPAWRPRKAFSPLLCLTAFSLFLSTSGLMASTKQQTKTLETCWNQVLPLHHRLLKVTTSAFIHVRNIQMSVPSPATMHFQESETYVGKCTGILAFACPTFYRGNSLSLRDAYQVPDAYLSTFHRCTSVCNNLIRSYYYHLLFFFLFFYIRENWGPREIKWLATQLKSDEN